MTKDKRMDALVDFFNSRLPEDSKVCANNFIREMKNKGFMLIEIPFIDDGL
jgi:hypothetical protein